MDKGSNRLNEYNDIPVHYCKSCLSLRIKTVTEDSDLDYCDECGCTDIDTTNIAVWENIYKDRYGFNYLENYIK